MASQPTEFGIRLPDIFFKGFEGYSKNIVPLTLGALATLGVYGVFRFQAQQLQEEGVLTWSSLGVDFLGFVAAGTIAYPWYYYALHALRGEPISLAAPFAYKLRFMHQAVASFFFGAGFLLGIKYPVFGIPLLAMFVLVSYAFYGFVVADTPPDKEGMRGGSYALGTSVRLGEKRRFGLFAIACLFMLFNVFGMLGVAIEGNTLLRYAATVLGLSITTSVTLVGGAYIYDELNAKLPKTAQNTVVKTRAKKKKDKKRG